MLINVLNCLLKIGDFEVQSWFMTSLWRHNFDGRTYYVCMEKEDI